MLVVGALAFIGGGALLGVWLGERLNPPPRTTVWGESASAVVYRETPGDSPDFAQSMRRLRNELPYRTSWTDGDAAFVIDLLDRDLGAEFEVGEDAPAPARREATEAVIETTFAILISSHALGAGVEMGEEARRDTEALLLAYLEDPNPYLRRLGVGAMFDSGMIEQDMVYRWVNEIAANDPDEETREFAAFELNYFDRAVYDTGAGRSSEGESDAGS